MTPQIWVFSTHERLTESMNANQLFCLPILVLCRKRLASMLNREGCLFTDNYSNSCDTTCLLLSHSVYLETFHARTCVSSRKHVLHSLGNMDLINGVCVAL